MMTPFFIVFLKHYRDWRFGSKSSIKVVHIRCQVYFSTHGQKGREATNKPDTFSGCLWSGPLG